MMEKKIDRISLFAQLIIITGIGTALFSYFIKIGENPNPIILLLVNFLSAIAVHPRGLPWFFWFMQFAPSVVSVLIGLWHFGIIVCGFGILRKKAVARISFIVLCSLHLITFLIFQIFTMPNFVSLPYTDNSNIELFFSLNYYLVALLPIVYLIFLTRPKVKEQFK
ncbi:hypothetical protein ACFL2Y_02500 [Candidatus Omnitrophota bacterium]